MQQGDTRGSIAPELYGGEDRYSALVDANGADRRVEPGAGTELLVAYPLPHRVSPGETLSAISKQYLGDDAPAPEASSPVHRQRAYRAAGQVVLVLIVDLRLVAKGGSEAREAFREAATDGEAQALQQQIDAKLPELIQQVRDGQYEEAVALANRLPFRMTRLSSSQTVTIQKELAVAYVALERLDFAEAAFRTALALQPNLELDSVRTLAAVLEAFNAAKLSDDPERPPFQRFFLRGFLGRYFAGRSSALEGEGGASAAGPGSSAQAGRGTSPFSSACFLRCNRRGCRPGSGQARSAARLKT